MEETFPHLSKAPIVEAVIDIRTTPQIDFNESELVNKLKVLLPEYPKQEKTHAKSCEITLGKINEQATVTDLGFVGCKLHHNSEPYIAQFNKEAFVFSRLFPYNEWEIFSSEALRLWAIFEKIMKPEEIQRIGVRYINKIEFTDTTVELANYYTLGPESIPETNWPIAYFMHKDTYCPSDRYIVNVIKTIQSKQKKGLILDIDVIMNDKILTDINRKINNCLLEMKTLKNKAFFNSLRPEIIERFK